jgi:hypothetical protein
MSVAQGQRFLTKKLPHIVDKNSGIPSKAHIIMCMIIEPQNAVNSEARVMCISFQLQSSTIPRAQESALHHLPGQ